MAGKVATASFNVVSVTTSAQSYSVSSLQRGLHTTFAMQISQAKKRHYFILRLKSSKQHTPKRTGNYN